MEHIVRLREVVEEEASLIQQVSAALDLALAELEHCNLREREDEGTCTPVSSHSAQSALSSSGWSIAPVGLAGDELPRRVSIPRPLGW